MGEICGPSTKGIWTRKRFPVRLSKKAKSGISCLPQTCLAVLLMGKQSKKPKITWLPS